MFLVPYFWDTSSNREWVNFGLFVMNRGDALWGLEEEEANSKECIEGMLLENGFPVTRLIYPSDLPSPPPSQEMVFAEMDPSRLKLQNFYIWSELSLSDPADSEKDCWRVFKIPKVLWSCKIFQEHFWNSMKNLKEISQILQV